MGPISGTEAITYCPKLAALRDEWNWELRPLKRIELWGSHFTPEIQLGIFLYRDGSASVIRMDRGVFSGQYHGSVAAIVARANALMRPETGNWR
jgi:hypothetical protein